MNVLDQLIDAIDSKKTISFEYNKPGKTFGKRIGNPYAVFNFFSKLGTKSIKVHIIQTGGVSDSDDKNPLPNFRMFNLKDISNVQILEMSFEANDSKFNPNWSGYSQVIAKV